MRRTIEFTSPEGKHYRLNEQTAVLLVRPRGWHLPEKHVLVDGKPISGRLFDFALYIFHIAQELLTRDPDPTFIYRSWKAISKHGFGTMFSTSPRIASGIPRGTIRATVLIETILAAFEMDEILYELQDHSAGFNCGQMGLHFQLYQTIPE